MAAVGEDPAALDAILITHEHQDHVAGLAVLARRLRIPVFFTEPTHRAWVRMLTPRTTMSYAKWLEMVQREKETRADHSPAHTAVMTEIDAAADDPMELEAAEPVAAGEADAPKVKADPAFLPAVEYFRAGHAFSIGE